MARESHKKAVKVVVIETRYVETDEENFKVVVQSLTGKDSNVASPIEKRGFEADRRMVEGGAPVVAPGGLTAEELDRMMVEELLHVDI